MSTTEDRAEDQARAQVASITAMVAALDCDYDRLQELRDERDGYVHSVDGPPELDTPEQWAIDNPDDAAELKELEAAAGDCEDADQARECIQEDALSVEVRSGWQSAGETLEPSEFRIVLCTGGPHVEIQGELDANNEPDRVRILYSDWGTSGELFDFDHDAVLSYARCFHFGE